MSDFHKFEQTLTKYTTAESLGPQDIAEAFQNLSGFMSLLIRINEREQVVPTNGSGVTHED